MTDFFIMNPDNYFLIQNGDRHCMSPYDDMNACFWLTAQDYESIDKHGRTYLFFLSPIMLWVHPDRIKLIKRDYGICLMLIGEHPFQINEVIYNSLRDWLNGREDGD